MDLHYFKVMYIFSSVGKDKNTAKPLQKNPLYFKIIAQNKRQIETWEKKEQRTKSNCENYCDK